MSARDEKVPALGLEAMYIFVQRARLLIRFECANRQSVTEVGLRSQGERIELSQKIRNASELTGYLQERNHLGSAGRCTDRL